ncbi:MAG: FHA domain-containing protein [Acidobacteriota bacterium]
MSIQIEIRKPGGERQTVTIAKEIAAIGRLEQNDVVLPFHFVSSRHCRFLRQGTRMFVEDLGSTNGILVNGQQAPPRVPHALTGGDVIQIGTIEMRAQWVEEADVIEAAAPTIIEEAPAELASPRTEPRAAPPPARAAQPVSNEPATMWEIQTGVYNASSMQVDDHRVSTSGASAPVAPPPAFRAGMQVRASSPAGKTVPAIDSYQIWSVLFQAIGLATLFGGILVLVIVLLS